MASFDEMGTLDAAVLLLALGEETAAEVFKHLSPKEVQSLGEVMARTQYTTKDHVNRVLERFHEVAAGQSTLVDDSNAYVQGVLRRALGMQSLDDSIRQLFVNGYVSREDAIAQAAHPEKLER